MNDISALRKDYQKASLDEKTAASEPMKQFATWFNDAVAARVPEPNAMTLATVNENGRPAARIVLLKGIENNTFVFYTNYQSRKGKELDQNPACSLTFFWPELERQVRIEGIASRVDEKRSEDYFQSRPRGSQLGAWASPQSSVIQDRSLLEERIKQLEEKFKGQAVLPKPNQWGGYEIEPWVVEFWQGRPSRLHDRILYTKDDSGWKVNRLAP
jgi:pyridoxamine 5'-phosphate oxidase